MQTAILFVSTVLIWGTTWIGIAAEVGEAPVFVSIFYRFALSGVVMVAGLALLGRLKRPSHWRFVVLQALCLFSFNFIGLYNATASIPSGLVSVVFSLASIFNAVNARLFFGDRINPQTLLAGALGVCGLTLLFWHDLAVGFDPQTLVGLVWAVMGTIFFSFGNMASRKNSALGITPVVANSWGMGIGAAVVLILIALRGETLAVPASVSYWTALVYLAVIGSVVGFTTYLMLVARIGSARAGYATVLFPIVALTLSTLFEGYEWTASAFAGVFLAGLGNIVMFARR
ncbi:EamA-like transporter family protein [Fulvimarina manganoxydans]|uniref:EamA-like transporter family protein n=1 Tax=Fulvimarina manganoxydans TaxID=937218 RepID=A0A1W2AYU8_9HYPH|nr:EamA family transporter [Fulvimarina manganoxydans]SMC65866.1 EamA-like transporter family protein [Fulvimarina manganoxydans]